MEGGGGDFIVMDFIGSSVVMISVSQNSRVRDMMISLSQYSSIRGMISVSQNSNVRDMISLS